MTRQIYQYILRTLLGLDEHLDKTDVKAIGTIRPNTREINEAKERTVKLVEGASKTQHGQDLFHHKPHVSLSPFPQTTTLKINNLTILVITVILKSHFLQSYSPLTIYLQLKTYEVK